MLYTASQTTEVFEGSIPATERALYNHLKEWAEHKGHTIRGVYYTRINDPWTNHSWIEIKAWLRTH